MTLGARLREERQRLGLNQTDFAAVAGASKRAMVSWEKNDSAPLTTALVAWSEVGADALYILTGRRTNEGPNLSLASIEDELTTIRDNLLEPTRFAQSGETVDQTEERIVAQQIEVLREVLRNRGDVGTPDQIEEAKSLLDIAQDQHKLTAYRAADHAQRREKRQQIKAKISSWISLGNYFPSDTGLTMMADLSMEYGIPLRPLVELMYELLSNAEPPTP